MQNEGGSLVACLETFLGARFLLYLILGDARALRLVASGTVNNGYAKSTLP